MPFPKLPLRPPEPIKPPPIDEFVDIRDEARVAARQPVSDDLLKRVSARLAGSAPSGDDLLSRVSARLAGGGERVQPSDDLLSRVSARLGTAVQPTQPEQLPKVAPDYYAALPEEFRGQTIRPRGPEEQYRPYEEPAPSLWEQAKGVVQTVVPPLGGPPTETPLSKVVAPTVGVIEAVTEPIHKYVEEPFAATVTGPQWREGWKRWLPRPPMSREEIEQYREKVPGWEKFGVEFAPWLGGPAAIRGVTKIPSAVRGVGAVPKVVAGVDPVVAKLTTLIREAKPVREVTEVLKHEELSKRVAKAARILEKGEGREAFLKAKRPLKGELPKAQFSPPEPSMTPQEVTGLFNKIRDAKAPFFTRMETNEALQKLLLGEIPTRGELALLEDMFGADLVKAVLSKRTLGAKAWENVRELLNLPRAILASFDISAPLRQGVVLAPSKTKIWAKNIVPSVKAWGSEKQALKMDGLIKASPNYERGQKAGLYIAPLRGATVRAVEREEAFMSKFAQYIPGIRQSERSYVSYLNKLRQDVFDDVLRGWEGMGKTLKDDQDLALLINRATGRGGLGPLSQYGDILAGGFFSPRLISARFTLPLSAATGTKAVRMIAARQLAMFVGTGTAILSLIKLSGAADVELDPRSSDFGKIRIGNTRLDFWGGYQPIVRYTAQLLPSYVFGGVGWGGKRKTTGAGEFKDIGRFDTFFRFVRSKFSPQVSLAYDISTGESYIGDEMSLEAPELIEQAYNRLTPLFIQDMTDAIREEGLDGGFVALPGVMGVGVQTFKGIWDIQDRVAGDTFNLSYDQLNQGQRRVVRNHPDVQGALAKLEERGELTPEKETTVAVQRYEAVKVELETELRKKIDAGMKGVPLGRAISDFKSDRFNAAEVLFSEAVKQVLSGNRDIPIEDILAEAYWSADLPEDPLTGARNYRFQEEMRESVLVEADKVGVSREYITGTGEGTYRGQRFTDRVVRGVVEEYEADMEALRPYWEIKDLMYDKYDIPEDIRNQISGGIDSRKFYRQFPMLRVADRWVERERELMKGDNPQITALLQKWKGYK